jgi:hypothetical protein
MSRSIGDEIQYSPWSKILKKLVSSYKKKWLHKYGRILGGEGPEHEKRKSENRKSTIY